MGRDLPRLLRSCRAMMRKDRGLSGDLDRLPQLSWMMLLRLLDLSGGELLCAPYRWRDWAAGDALDDEGILAFVDHEEALRPDGTRGPGLFAHLAGLEGGPRLRVLAAVFRGIHNRMTSGNLLRQVALLLDGVGDDPQALSRLYEELLSGVRDAAGDSGEFYTPRPLVRFMVTVADPRPGEVVLDPACGTGGFLVEAQGHAPGIHLFGVEAKPLPHLLAQVNLLLHGVDDPCVDLGDGLMAPDRAPRSELSVPRSVDLVLTNPPFGGQEEPGVQASFPRDLRTADTTLLFLQRIMERLRSPGGRAAVVVPEGIMGGGGVARRVRQRLLREHDLHTVVRLPRGVFQPYTDIQSNLLFFTAGGPTRQTWFYQHRVPQHRRAMRDPCYTRGHPLRFAELEPLLAWWGQRQETADAWLVTADQLRRSRWSLDFRRADERPAAIQSPGDLNQQLRASLKRCQALMERVTGAVDATDSPADTREQLPLGAFLTRSRQRAVPEPRAEYQQITVRLHGRGVTRRATVSGSELSPRQFTARAGQLIMSRIDARNGAFGIVPPELDGAVVSGDFPLYDVRADLVLADYLALVLCSPAFVEICARCSRGTTNRKRVDEALLLEQRLRVPSLNAQARAVDAARLVRSLEGEASDLARDAGELLAALAGVDLDITDQP